MGLEYSSLVDAPIADVFAWYARPGAFNRLSPPWQPMRLVTEAASLKDGRATLALPGGLRWVAVHRPDGYDPPRRFVDEIGGDGLATLPARLAVRWRHSHEFEDAGDNRTRVIDRVDTPVPASLLRPMFTYRHRQLADDLAAHRLAAENGLGPATIAVTGSSGLVGSALTAFLRTGGHRVIQLVRGNPHDDDERRWNPEDPDPGLLAGVDAAHPSGRRIDRRPVHRKASTCHPRQQDRPDPPAGRTAGPHRSPARRADLGVGDRLLRLRPR